MKSVQENEANGFCLCTDPVTLRQGQGQWKWYKMVDVDGAYKHGNNENIWLNSLRAMSNISLCHIRQPASQMNMTHYIDP